MIPVLLAAVVCYIPPNPAPPQHLTAAEGSAYVATGDPGQNVANGLSPSGLPWNSTIETGIPGAPPFKLLSSTFCLAPPAHLSML